MHSLVGTYLIKGINHEYFNGKCYFKLEIKVSEYFKRVIFFDNYQHADLWMREIRTAQGYRDVNNEFTFEYILGEGSYGRVYKASKRNEKSPNFFAIK